TTLFRSNTCEPAGWQSAWIGLIVHFRLVRIEIPQVRIKANIALLGKFSVIVRQLIDAWLTVWIDICPPRTERPGRARKLIFCVVRVLRVYTLSPVHACTSSAEYPWLWSPIDGIQCLERHISAHRHSNEQTHFISPFNSYESSLHRALE